MLNEAKWLLENLTGGGVDSTLNSVAIEKNTYSLKSTYKSGGQLLMSIKASNIFEAINEAASKAGASVKSEITVKGQKSFEVPINRKK